MYFSPFAPPSPTAPKAPAIPSQNLPQNLPHTSPNLLKPSPKMTSPTHFFGGENYESDLLFCGGLDSWIFLGKKSAKTWSKRAQSGHQGRLERALGCLGRGLRGSWGRPRGFLGRPETSWRRLEPYFLAKFSHN